MKRIAVLFLLLIVLLSCTPKPARHISSGRYETGKCYLMITDNPFQDQDVIEIITDIQGEYYQYQIFLGTYYGYGHKYYGSLWMLKNYKEVSCPKFLGIF